MAGKLHLLKLSVGTESVDDLAAWQQTVIARNRAAGLGAVASHVTRMWPRREPELLDGGSIYWVIRGSVLCRQRIVGLDERRGEDGIRRCAILLDPALVRTLLQPRRAFQGWRYLQPADAPADLGSGGPDDAALPEKLTAELNALGII